MKKLRKIMLKSIISFVLAIALVTGAVPLPNMGGLLPNLVIKANAAEYTANPTTKDELVPLASSGSVSEAHVVKYANKEWYVIGYDGVGLASESGTMTLFLKGTLGSHEFSDNYSNVYANSSIHSYLGSYLANTANFKSNESAAVVARTLSGGASTGNSHSSHVSGDSVDANLWLLSAAEARKLPQNIIKSGGDGNGWWLRSPGSSGNANYMPVSPDGTDVPKESGAGVGFSKSVRAAMLLDLNSVIYSSETNTLIAQEAEAHNITVSVDNNQGSVDAPSRADKGETVKFTITPAVGYAVDTVKFNDTSLSPVNGVYSFTMPNVDVTISVTFAQIYRVEDHIEQDGDTYTIKTTKGWEVFCDCVKSDAYNGFGGKTVKLGLDITDGVTVSAGIPGKPFYGTFDGDGHTLAVALNSTEEWVAPFSVFSGSIKNLTVTGTVKGSNYAGGLTGLTFGGSIENVTVNADISGSSKIGGITGYCNFGSLLVKNTVFNGSLQCDRDVCGLIGWASENVGYNQAITIENCLFNGSYTCGGEFHPITVRNSNSTFAYTDNGAYYTVVPKLSSEDYIICAGTHVSTIIADNEFKITTNPTCSFDSVDYYAEGTAISLEGSGSIESVVINNGTVEVIDNQNGTYSFTMPDCNVTVVDKLMQMISFESATQTKTYGDEDFTVTATHSVGDGEVSYAVTEGTDVAEVNSSTGAVTIKKAGTAIITATAAAKNNFAEATAQYTLTVNPKSITIPTAISGLKWTGDEQTGVTDGTGYTVTNGKATDVGGYTATAVLTDKDNTKWSNGSTDDQSITWSIAKVDGSAAPTGLTGTAPTTDGGSDGKISGVDSTMEYSNNSSFESATDCSGTEITGLSEGTYYVRVKETETHEAGVYATVTVPEYNDNSAKVKQAPIPKTNLVYNGMAQDLVEAGEAENGTMYYAVTTENTAPADDLYTTSNYTATDAGTYYVWYKVVGDDNLNNSEAEKVTVTISQLSIKNATVSLDETDLVYTGSEQSVQVSSVKIGETVLKANSDYEVSGTTGTNKGDYTVTVTGKGNYKDVVTSKWNIAMATPVIDVLPSASAITYGQSLADSTLTEGTAKLEENVVEGTFSWKDDATKPAVSDSEKTEYVVVFTPNDADNLNTVECKVKVTVNKALAGVVKSPTADTLTYNGKAQALVKAGEATDGIMNYAIGKDDKTAPAEGWNTSIPTATNAGTYHVWYRVVGDDNHSDSAIQKVDVTIEVPDTNELEVSLEGWTYGEKAKQPTVKADFGADKVSYSYSDKEDGTFKADVPSSVGTWYVKATIPKTDNYPESEAIKSFKIAQADSISGAPDISKSVDYTVDTVGKVELPDNWIWKTADSTKALTIGTAVEAAAEYTGTDKDNYVDAVKTVKVSIIRNACTHDNLEEVSEVPATCTKEGVMAHYKCPVCNKLFIKDGNQLIEKTADELKIAALGHSYGKTTYSWSEDHSTCTATKVCVREDCDENTNGHVVTETVNSTSETTPATCENKGVTTYTATFTNTDFGTATDSVEIAAKGHNYVTTYEWSEDGKTCTATATCSNDNTHKITETAQYEADKETSKIKAAVKEAATTEKMGTTAYTATFDNKLFTAQTKDVVDIPKVENPAENPSENPSENPAENPSENPAENPSENPSQGGQDNPQQGNDSSQDNQKSEQTAADKPKEIVTDKPSEKTADTPATPVENKTTTVVKEEGTTIPVADNKAEVVVTSKPSEEPSVAYKRTTDESAKAIEIPETVVSNGVTYAVTEISEGAFENNKTVESVKLGDNITTLGENAFAGCTSLKTVSIPDSVKEIGDAAFSGCTSLKTVSIPNSVKEIGANTFNGCTSLKKVSIPNSVTEIGAGAFNGCKKLTSMNVGKNVKKVGDVAFANCTSLKTVTISAKTNTLGRQVFKGSKKLKTITIKSKKLTAKTLAKNAFMGVSDKVIIKVPKGKKESYTKLFRKKGLSKKVKIK